MTKRIDLPLDEIAELYGAGVSSYRIAERYGVGQPAVLRNLRKAGVPIRHTRAIDLVGQRFGHLVVEKRAGVVRLSNGWVGAAWLCACDCGSKVVARGSKLREGEKKSCGCSSWEGVTKHGYSRVGKRAKEYTVWAQAKHRCTNPKVRNYADYGGRGIRMCAEWSDSFEAFMRDMGPRPEGGSIDRIDNDQGYFKANCRWSTPKEQANNRRPRRWQRRPELSI